MAMQKLKTKASRLFKREDEPPRRIISKPIPLAFAPLASANIPTATELRTSAIPQSSRNVTRQRQRQHINTTTSKSGSWRHSPKHVSCFTPLTIAIDHVTPVPPLLPFVKPNGTAPERPVRPESDELPGELVKFMSMRVSGLGRKEDTKDNLNSGIKKATESPGRGIRKLLDETLAMYEGTVPSPPPPPDYPPPCVPESRSSDRGSGSGHGSEDGHEIERTNSGGNLGRDSGYITSGHRTFSTSPTRKLSPLPESRNEDAPPSIWSTDDESPFALERYSEPALLQTAPAGMADILGMSDIQEEGEDHQDEEGDVAVFGRDIEIVAPERMDTYVNRTSNGGMLVKREEGYLMLVAGV